MIFKARRDSVISSTSSDIGSHYSRSTGIEQDDDDDTTIENTQNSLERHLEASEIPPEKVQSSPGSEADTGENLSSKLTEIKKNLTNLFDEAEKILSEASLPGKDLQNRLRRTQEERDHYIERKKHHKRCNFILKREIQDLREDSDALQKQLAASQQEAVDLRKARSEMIEMGKKIFAA
jgi:chromosome segregation ATPase